MTMAPMTAGSVTTEIVPLCRRDLALMPALAPALAELGRLTGAPAWLVRALGIDPALVSALINLGAFRCGAGDAEGAAVPLARALALAPDEPSAWFNQGVARGRTPAAVLAYRRSLALAPSADAATYLAHVLRDGDPLISAIPVYLQALALAPSDPLIFECLAFCRSYDPEASSPEIFRLERRWAALVAQAPLPAPALPLDPAALDPDRRLRVAYLSADLYDHPVGRNLVGLVEHHDRNAVEVCLYDLREGDDAIARRLRAAVSLRRAVAGLDDRALAETIRSDRIDLLVLLAGHTPFNRLALADLRPAPVQVAMHDFTTSGLPSIDAVLGDAMLMPEGGEEGFVETVIRLPTFYLHEPLPDVPIHARPPLGPDEPLVLVSANNPAKLNDRVIDLWGRILLRLPRARLLLKYRDRFGDPLVQRRWFARLALSSVGADRLLFHTGDEDLASHLAVIGDADLALDPFPFNGCTTSYEALWMGLAVVTLVGKRFVGRAGAAMLQPLGLSDLAVADEDAYVAAALGLAADPARRARLRAELRPRLRSSALLDASAHAASVEAAYRRLWRDCCARKTKERNPVR